MLKWPKDHFPLKFQNATNPVFKPQKWLTYPQCYSPVLADFMVDETSPVNICWKHTEGKKTI